VSDAPVAVPAALRTLAALLRTGMPIRRALAAWPDHCSADARAGAALARARLSLGDDPARSVAAVAFLGDDAPVVAAIVGLQQSTGCDGAGLLDAAARRIERRAALTQSALSATAGARLSGRIIAGLPLAIVPLLPAAGASLFDRRGSLLVICGAALLLAGGAWIGRLLPRPPGPDDAGEIAELVAAALDAGVDVDGALRLCARACPGSARTELEGAFRRVALGQSWGDALECSTDDGLRGLAEVVARGQRLGTPMAASLRAFASNRRVDQEGAFERSLRRAPVLMVLPLTTCILPAYVLLAIGPVLRGLSLGS
jgi:tight adherence protein B